MVCAHAIAIEPWTIWKTHNNRQPDHRLRGIDEAPGNIAVDRGFNLVRCARLGSETARGPAGRYGCGSEDGRLPLTLLHLVEFLERVLFGLLGGEG